MLPITKQNRTETQPLHLLLLTEENIERQLLDSPHNWHALQSKELPQLEKTDDL